MSRSTAQRNVEVVRRLIAIFNEGGFDALLANFEQLYHPEIEWRGGPAGQSMVGESKSVFRGYDGVRRFHEEYREDFEEVRFEDPRYEAVGDRVVLMRCRLSMKGRGSGLTATHDSYAQVFELEDGKVIGGEIFFSQPGARAEARRLAKAEDA